MIKIKNFFLRRGEFKLEVPDLVIKEGEYFVLLGPTGSGKTLFLKCIAGICKPTGGEVWIENRNVTAIPPEGRNVGYVPQDNKLFSYLTVERNVAFGLRKRKKSMFKNKIMDLMDLVEAKHLLKRKNVSHLSAGEKQRISLARALAVEPKLLLLDEPLSALDVETGKILRRVLKKMHEKLGTTTIHVTHNLEEADELAHTIGQIKDGVMQKEE